MDARSEDGDFKPGPKAFQVEFRPGAVREIKKLPPKIQAQVLEVAAALARNPTPAGSRKLSGYPFWRVASGDYRIIYSLDQAAGLIVVLRVRHRRRVYEHLNRLI